MKKILPMLIALIVIASCQAPATYDPVEIKTDAKNIQEFFAHFDSIDVKTEIIYADSVRNIYVIKTLKSYRETISLLYDFNKVKYIEIYSNDRNRLINSNEYKFTYITDPMIPNDEYSIQKSRENTPAGKYYVILKMNGRKLFRIDL